MVSLVKTSPKLASYGRFPSTEKSVRSPSIVILIVLLKLENNNLFIPGQLIKSIFYFVFVTHLMLSPISNFIYFWHHSLYNY
jgi:hypothetical protein